jgi:hypothetical protein
VSRWPLVKDVLLTGTGVVIVLSQVAEAYLGQQPNALLIGAGLALTVPSIADHVKGLLPGSTDGPSSSQSESSGHSPSPSSSSSPLEDTHND